MFELFDRIITCIIVVVVVVIIMVVSATLTFLNYYSTCQGQND